MVPSSMISALVHIGFADPEPRVPDDVERDLAVGETDGEMLAAARTEVCGGLPRP